MLFVEFRFFIFFALVLAVFWGMRSNRNRKVWLLITSYVFYGAWDWRFLSLILLSTVVDFFIGGRLHATAPASARKRLLMVSLFCNLGLLAFFKYCNFFIDSAVGFLNLLGLNLPPTTLAIILPVGISFYTFQTLSYTIDIYRRRLEPTVDLLDFALFVGFFPQLVAGPIVRARDFLPQLERPARAADVHVRAAVLLFALGFFKKACVSDNIAPFVDAYFADPGSYDAMSAWLGTTLYAVQIYCDFSGYSDMAIACAALLGYRLCRNFAHPYFASGISEFWRRWHMSLSSWLRDYLYITLGGNRGSKLFTYRNLLATMLLGGLWHGASWTFVIWGAMHGGALIVQREVGRLMKGVAFYQNMPAAMGILITFWWVNATWIFFRAADFSSAFVVLRGYLFFSADGTEALPVVLWGHVVVLAILHRAFDGDTLFHRLKELPPVVFYPLAGAASAGMLALVPTGYRPFIYFQF